MDLGQPEEPDIVQILVEFLVELRQHVPAEGYRYLVHVILLPHIHRILVNWPI